MLRSLAATGIDLMRAISLAALPARSACAADAVEPSDSMPVLMTARSGFFETMASPLVRIAGSIEEEVVVAEGPATISVGRLEATTIAATAREQATTTPSGTRMARICRHNDATCDEVTSLDTLRSWRTRSRRCGSGWLR